jgi:DNA repair protein RadC
MNAPFQLNEKTGTYTTKSELTEEDILTMATQITRSKFSRGESLTSPSMVRLCLSNYLSVREREVFVVIFLDSQNRVIDHEEMFSGTIDSASVYPREVVKAALKCNAKSLVLAHNHPSGVPEPSQADRTITRKLADALDLVDVNVLDHFVVGVEGVVSFAERGWI